MPPDDVPAAQRARRVAVEVGGALRRGVADLTGDPGRPLPPLANPRWRALRWTPHAVVVLVAVVTTASAGPVLHSGYGVPVALTTALVLAQGFALVLALYRPLQGWWLSIVVILLLAVATAPPAATQLYPLPAPALIGELVLLAVVAAQLPARVTSAVWVVTLAAQAVPALVLGGNADGVTAFALLSVLALLATSALRSRGEVGRRLAEQEQRTEVERARRAVLEERARIARELHDVVAHHMSVVAIQAEAAPYRVSEVPPELLTTLTTIRGSALEALAELRRVLGVLRADGAAGDPPEEPARDPAPSLAELDPLLARVRGLGHPVSMSVVGEPRALPAGVELSAYRIVQESLSNVVRHAPRAPVELELSYADDGLGLVVRNAPCPGEGRSAGPAPVALAQGTGAGHGLLGMRERAAALGGEVVAGPLAGGGFEVRAVLPSEVPVAGRGADAG